MKRKPFLMARISLLFIIISWLIYFTGCGGAGTILSSAASGTSGLTGYVYYPVGGQSKEKATQNTGLLVSNRQLSLML